MRVAPPPAHMKHVVVLLSTTTAALAGTSAYFWQEVRDQRERNASIETRVVELETQLRTAGTPMPEPPPPPLVAQVAPEAPPAPMAPPPPAPRVATAPEPTFQRLDPREHFARERERMQDPEYRALRREQQKMGLMRIHSDLGSALNMSDEELDKFLDLLADQQLQQMANAPPFMPGAEGQQPSPEWMRNMQENQRKREAEIQAFLGDAKYQEWQDYQNSMGARMQVRQLRSMLEGSTEPLRDDQYETLVKVMAEQQQLGVESRMDFLRNRPSGPLTQADQLTLMEQTLEHTAEQNRRMRDAAAAYLSSAQLERFDKMLKQQLDMQRVNVRMMRERGESGGMQTFVSDGSSIVYSSGGGPIGQAFITQGTAVAVPAPPPPPKQ